MKVFVEPTGRRIAPFGDPVAETPVENRPLSAWLDEAIAGAGFTRIDRLEPPCLVVPDALLCTAGALSAFVNGAEGRDAVFVLKRSRFGETTTPVQPRVVPVEEGWRFEALRFVSGRDEAPVDVVVDPEEQLIEFPVQPHFVGTDTVSMGIARHPVMTLHHWVHILWANQVIGGIELRSTPAWRWALRGLWAALRARSINKWRVLGKLNRIGKGCDIHPTAIVEGSTLGPGCSVGPYSRVLFSKLGAGVNVMQHCSVELCTLGDRATVSEQTCLRFSVLYPDAVASQYLMQQCVLGRATVTTGGSFSMDLNFDQDIRVPLDGALHSTGTRFLGSAFGHRSRVGTGFWLASGRMVPNDYFLIRDPDKVLSKLPDGLPGREPLIAGERALRPITPASSTRP